MGLPGFVPLDTLAAISMEHWFAPPRAHHARGKGSARRIRLLAAQAATLPLSIKELIIMGALSAVYPFRRLA